MEKTGCLPLQGSRVLKRLPLVRLKLGSLKWIPSLRRFQRGAHHPCLALQQLRQAKRGKSPPLHPRLSLMVVGKMWRWRMKQASRKRVYQFSSRWWTEMQSLTRMMEGARRWYLWMGTARAMQLVAPVVMIPSSSCRRSSSSHSCPLSQRMHF